MSSERASVNGCFPQQANHRINLDRTEHTVHTLVYIETLRNVQGVSHIEKETLHSCLQGRNHWIWQSLPGVCECVCVRPRLTPSLPPSVLWDREGVRQEDSVITDTAVIRDWPALTFDLPLRGCWTTEVESCSRTHQTSYSAGWTDAGITVESHIYFSESLCSDSSCQWRGYYRQKIYLIIFTLNYE